MKKILLLICALVLSFGFTGCGKDSSNSNDTTGIKTGDRIEYKLINSGNKQIYLDFLYFNATEAEQVLTSYKFTSGTFIVFNTVKNNQKIGLTVRGNITDPKVDVQILVNGVVIKSGYIGNGAGNCVLYLQ